MHWCIKSSKAVKRLPRNIFVCARARVFQHTSFLSLAVRPIHPLSPLDDAFRLDLRVICIPGSRATRPYTLACFLSPPPPLLPSPGRMSFCVSSFPAAARFSPSSVQRRLRQRERESLTHTASQSYKSQLLSRASRPKSTFLRRTNYLSI